MATLAICNVHISVMLVNIEWNIEFCYVQVRFSARVFSASKSDSKKHHAVLWSSK